MTKRSALQRHPQRHGLRSQPEYQIWLQMKARCHNRRNKAYRHYGRRGIKVCKRWRESFAAFYADVGPRPTSGHLIERRNNSRGYEPGNCYWATRAEQSRNKRNNVWIEFDGKRMVRRDWEKHLGMRKGTLSQRLISYGWTVERALTTPCGSPRKNSILLTHNGQTKPMVDWARELGVNYATVKTRHALGLSFEEIFSPISSRGKRR